MNLVFTIASTKFTFTQTSMIYQKAKINIAMKLNFINKYIFKILNYELSHRVNQSICAPLCTSSDWSTHVFAIGTSQMLCNMPRKFMSVKAKQRQKVGDAN